MASEEDLRLEVENVDLRRLPDAPLAGMSVSDQLRGSRHPSLGLLFDDVHKATDKSIRALSVPTVTLSCLYERFLNVPGILVRRAFLAA